MCYKQNLYKNKTKKKKKKIKRLIWHLTGFDVTSKQEEKHKKKYFKHSKDYERISENTQPKALKSKTFPIIREKPA